MKSLIRLFRILTPRERKQSIFVLFIVLGMAMFEVIGIGSIGPLMAIIADPSIIEGNEIYAYFYNYFGFNNYWDFTLAVALAVIILIAVSNGYTALTMYAIQRFSYMRMHTLGLRLIRNYLGEPYSFFLKRNSSELSKNILNEVSQVVGGILNPLIIGIAKGLVAVAISVFLILTDPRSALLIILILGFGFGFFFLIVRRRLVFLGKERVEANAQRFKAAAEAFSGIKEARIMGLESRFADIFKIGSLRLAKTEVKTRILTLLPRHLVEPFAIFAIIAIVLIYASREGTITSAIPVLSVYAFGGARLLTSIQIAFQGISSAKNSLPSIDLLYNDFKSREKVIDLEAQKDKEVYPLKFVNAFTAKNIRYRYSGTREPVIKDVNIEIKKNQAVGLVGPTGCGKTTLVDIFLGLLEIEKGELLADNKKIDSSNIKAWQKNFGYVPQQIFLIDDTITKNIAFGLLESEIDHKRIEEVASIANIHNFIKEELPDGYDTIVGERGIRLSGGQRQRIGIARALYRDPDIIILDEATSSLDTLTERAVMEAIDNLMHKKTIILIAHRLDTVKKCDSIYVMKAGNIIASGSYSELIQSNEYFRLLTNA